MLFDMIITYGFEILQPLLHGFFKKLRSIEFMQGLNKILISLFTCDLSVKCPYFKRKAFEN